MKKEQKSTISLEKYFDGIFHLIAFSEDSILSKMELRNSTHQMISNRLLTNILKEMVSRDFLVREKLLGRKQKGYAINEEISLGKMGESYTITGSTKKGLPIYTKMTQRELNREIKEVMRNYKKAIRNKKSQIHQDDKLFFVAHTTWVSICLSWISRLTLSIDGGVLQGETKIGLARKNILLLENFIQELCFRIQEKRPDGYDLFLTTMHNFFEYLDPFADTPYSRVTKEPSSLIR